MGTPRRLALLARGVAVSQEELVVTKIGPAKSIAFDKDGNPTKSAIGFAKGQGIDIAEIKTAQTDKVEYICAEKKEKPPHPAGPESTAPSSPRISRPAPSPSAGDGG